MTFNRPPRWYVDLHLHDPARAHTLVSASTGTCRTDTKVSIDTIVSLTASRAGLLIAPGIPFDIRLPNTRTSERSSR